MDRDVRVRVVTFALIAVAFATMFVAANSQTRAEYPTNSICLYDRDEVVRWFTDDFGNLNMKIPDIPFDLSPPSGRCNCEQSVGANYLGMINGPFYLKLGFDNGVTFSNTKVFRCNPGYSGTSVSAFTPELMNAIGSVSQDSPIENGVAESQSSPQVRSPPVTQLPTDSLEDNGNPSVDTSAVLPSQLSISDQMSLSMQRFASKSKERTKRFYEAAEKLKVADACITIVKSRQVSSNCDFVQGVPMYQTFLQVVDADGCPSDVSAEYLDPKTGKYVWEFIYKKGNSVYTCGGPVEVVRVKD